MGEEAEAFALHGGEAVGFEDVDAEENRRGGGDGSGGGGRGDVGDRETGGGGAGGRGSRGFIRAAPEEAEERHEDRKQGAEKRNARRAEHGGSQWALGTVGRAGSGLGAGAGPEKVNGVEERAEDETADHTADDEAEDGLADGGTEVELAEEFAETFVLPAAGQAGGGDFEAGLREDFTAEQKRAAVDGERGERIGQKLERAENHEIAAD
jgi:hypothetical protein